MLLHKNGAPFPGWPLHFFGLCCPSVAGIALVGHFLSKYWPFCLVERISYTILHTQNATKMTHTTTQDKAKAAIKKMKSFDINKLNAIANKYNSSLAAVTFWYNAIHN